MTPPRRLAARTVDVDVAWDHATRGPILTLLVTPADGRAPREIQFTGEAARDFLAAAAAGLATLTAADEARAQRKAAGLRGLNPGPLRVTAWRPGTGSRG